MMQGQRCPVCRKEFFPTIYWVYKKEGVLYCSWKCYRAKIKNQPKPYAKMHKKVEMLDTDGNVVKTFDGIREAADYVGGSYSRMSQVCREKLTYKKHMWRYREDEMPEV